MSAPGRAIHANDGALILVTATYQEDLRSRKRRRSRRVGTLPARPESWLLALLGILALAFTVRVLTANFLRTHLNDSSWFQFGAYAMFDRQAQDILDHKQPAFSIADASRTDKIVYPPGYPLWLAFIYKFTGNRSAVAVQYVQMILDAAAVLLIVGIGVSAFGWTVGVTAGVLAALSPLLAFAGATPNADAPTSWLILAGVWCFVLAFKKTSNSYAIAAGALLGLACWLRLNPLFLFFPWALVFLFLLRDVWRTRIVLAGALTLATLLVIVPIIIRNIATFYPQIAPTGLGFGWNLLAGIGETERGPEFGAPCCDAEMIEQDRRAMNAPSEAEVGLYFPDGIRRDRQRGKRALQIIAAHPLWFAGAAVRRSSGHLKYFGDPVPRLGTAGINVTSAKSLPPARQAGLLAFIVNVLGSIQSVLRTVVLPLMIIGIVIGWRRDWRITALLLVTILYYLFTLGIAHSEVRYGLPMQALLLLFAAVTLQAFAHWLRQHWVAFRAH